VWRARLTRGSSARDREGGGTQGVVGDRRRAPALATLLARLNGRAGTGDLRGKLEELAFLADFAGNPPDGDQLVDLARRLVTTVLGATPGANGG
jgi:hypothetical protein